VSKREAVTGQCRKLHNEELHILYSSPNIIRVIKWIRRWARNLTCTEERRGEMFRRFDRET
jgi:hypothetical protein